MDDQNDDDLVFAYNRMPPRSYGNPSYSQQSSSSPLWKLFMWMDFFTGPNFGILIAILIICFLHFKSNILNFFFNALEDGWRQTLVECLLGLRDLTRAYCQMTSELIRNFRYSMVPPPIRSTLRAKGTGSGSHLPALVILSEKPDTITPEQTVSQFNHSPASYSAARSQSPSMSSSSSSVPHAPWILEEIEPAFLHENDYPPGWLVYHPALGVVPKEEADLYEKQHSKSMHSSALNPSRAATG